MDLYLKRTDNRGLGVFAGRPFAKGEIVARATGTEIDCQTEHSFQIGWHRHLEPDPPTRFFNHSCRPNLGVRTNNHGWPEFVALRDIAAGEELTYDYAMTEYRHYERSLPELEFDLTCRCGAARCRGKLGYYSELSEELKEEYAGFISDYLLGAESGESGEMRDES